LLKRRPITMTLLGIAAAFGVRSMPANAEDLDAGKSAAQLFESDCSSCHRTPYGLAKRMNNSSLDRFLREHYTASRASAGTLSAYLIGLGGSARESQHKQLELVTPTTNHRIAPPLAQQGEPGGKPPGEPQSAARADPPMPPGPPPDGAKGPEAQHKQSESATPTTNHRTAPVLAQQGEPDGNPPGEPQSAAPAPPPLPPAAPPMPPGGPPKGPEGGAPTKSAYIPSRLNLRQAAGEDSPIVTVIPAGSTVQVADCTNGWCPVEYQDQHGYAIATGLEIGGRVRHAGQYAPPPGPDREGEPVYGRGPPYYGPPQVYYGPPYYYYGPRYYYYGPRWGYYRPW
jgi:hypothetical protein